MLPVACKHYTGSDVDNTKFSEIGQYCSDPPLNKIKNLIAVMFRKMKIGEKTFYLIGENHHHPDMCEPDDKSVFIDGLIRSVIKAYPSRTYDVFLEIEMLKTGIKEEHKRTISISFNLLIKNFNKCLRLTDRMCEKNLRVHYVNYRDYLKYLYETSHQKIYGTSPDKLDLEYIKELINKTKRIIISQKVLKQYDNIQNRELAKKIYEWFSLRMIEKIGLIEGLYSQFEGSRKVKFQLAFTLYLLIGDIMDIYAAGRMFRDFGEYNSKFIIYYAGAVHAETMYELLVHLGATEEMKVGDKMDQESCIPFDAEKVFS